jgi:hypothetical protein
MSCLIRRAKYIHVYPYLSYIDTCSIYKFKKNYKKYKKTQEQSRKFNKIQKEIEIS